MTEGENWKCTETNTYILGNREVAMDMGSTDHRSKSFWTWSSRLSKL